MTTTLLELKPSQIKPHEHNVRRDVGDVTELADSMKTKGILEPLIVAPMPKSGRHEYVLIAGHRRLAAARAAKLPTVPAIVREDLADDEQAQLEHMLVENLQRTDLSPVEEAQAYQQLLEFPGYTQSAIAAATGRPKATIAARLKVGRLPESELDRVHAGQLTLSEATALADFADEPNAYRRLLGRVGDRQDFANQFATEKERRVRDRSAAKLRKQLQGDGVRLVDDPGWQLNGLTYVDADHRDCPGFAAFIRANEGNSARVMYVCDQPALHRTISDPDSIRGRGDNRSTDPASDEPRAPVADAAEEQQRAAREQVTADLSTAADERREHLARALAAPTEDMAFGAIRGLLTTMLTEYGLAVPDWIRLAIGACPTADIVPDDEDDSSMRAAIFALDLEQCVVLAHLLERDAADLSLRSRWPWTGRAEYSGSDWIDELADVYRYQWTPAEQRLVDERTAIRAAAEREQAAADGDVDDQDLAGGAE